MKFRFHRGGLDASMETMIEVPNRAALIAAIRKTWGYEMLTTVTVEPYGFDDRINWDTHIVCDDRGVIGFTDGPCDG